MTVKSKVTSNARYATVGELTIAKVRRVGTRRRWRPVLKPVVVGAGAISLALGVLATGAGTAGAARRTKEVTNFASYVGGHGKANPRLSPVYIGVVNQQTAPNAPTPTWTTGVEIAQKFINQHAGGIDGHPVDLILCKIPTTVGSAAKCGQEFADNPKVIAVAAGGIDVGNSALESALKPAKKPLFFCVSLSTVDEKYTYGFILYGTTAQVEAPMASTAHNLHIKSVSVVYPLNIPGNVYQATVVEDALKYVGIKRVYKVGFTSSDTNFSEPFDAAHVGHTTLLILVNSGGPACSDTYLTLKSLGIATKTKVLVNVPCDTPTVAKADGGTLPHDWYYLTAVPMPGSHTPALAAFLKVADSYGKGAVAVNAWTGNGFGEVTTIAKLATEILKAHKKLTPLAVFAAGRAFKGPVALGAPHLDCGGFKGAPATCNDLDRFYQNVAPTVMKPLGSWISSPKVFTPPVT